MRINRKLGLTHMEYQIMELLWLADGPLSVDQIVSIIGVGWTKPRTQQNVKNCLNRLHSLGLVNGKDSSVYYAMYTKKEMEAILAKKKEDNNRENFILLKLRNLLDTDELSEKDVEELKKILYGEVEREDIERN